jgi:hypothetical protein
MSACGLAEGEDMILAWTGIKQYGSRNVRRRRLQVGSLPRPAGMIVDTPS